MFTATGGEIPRGRSLPNEVLHGVIEEFQRGATMDGRRKAKTKRKDEEEEEGLCSGMSLQSTTDGITFMNCCCSTLSQGWLGWRGWIN